MIKCQYLRFRHKKGELYYYCTKHRQNVNKECFRECLDKEYKITKQINKKSKKKITVSKETYNKVYLRDKGMCRLYDDKCEMGIQLHHIKYRSERKDLIDEPSNCILLCPYHHRKVHSNKKKWQPILIDMVNFEK